MNLHIAVTLLTTDSVDPETTDLETPRLVADIIPLILVVVRAGLVSRFKLCPSLDVV